MRRGRNRGRAQRVHAALKHYKYLTAFGLINAIRSPKYTQAICELRHDFGVPVYCHRRKHPLPPVYSLSALAPRVA